MMPGASTNSAMKLNRLQILKVSSSRKRQHKIGVLTEELMVIHKKQWTTSSSIMKLLQEDLKYLVSTI